MACGLQQRGLNTVLTAWVLLEAILYFPAASGQDVSEASSRQLPPGVLRALAKDEAAYCEQYLDDNKKGCREAFQSNLLWRQLVIAPSGQTALLVESHNIGFCGSKGCSLYVFLEGPNREYSQVLGKHGSTGALADVEVLKTVTRGHYNLEKTWSDGTTKELYRWGKVRYKSKGVATTTQ